MNKNSKTDDNIISDNKNKGNSGKNSLFAFTGVCLGGLLLISASLLCSCVNNQAKEQSGESSTTAPALQSQTTQSTTDQSTQTVTVTLPATNQTVTAPVPITSAQTAPLPQTTPPQGSEQSDTAAATTTVTSTSAPAVAPEILSVIIDSQKINSNGTYTVVITAKGSKYLKCYLGAEQDMDKISASQWHTMTDGVIKFEAPPGEYTLFVKNKAGTATYSEKIIIKFPEAKPFEINISDTYLNVGMNVDLSVKTTDNNAIDKIEWQSSDKSVIKITDGKAVALKSGTATITASAGDSLQDSVTLTVTDILNAPQIDSNKPLLWGENLYTEQQGELIDDILESRINAAGIGTRAAVVAAARFIPLELTYKVPYFFENGRLDPVPGRMTADGEGRYYHKGLYLTKSKYSVIDKDKTVTGPAAWGEPLKNLVDLAPYKKGEYYPNGLDCSGFVSWCFYNAGIPIGDVGAGDYENYTFEFSDMGERKELTPELLKSDEIQVGDLLWRDAHIAVIVGLEADKIYIAESYFNGLEIVVYSRNNTVINDDFTHAVLMDEVYEKYCGDGNLTDMWTDYSGKDYKVKQKTEKPVQTTMAATIKPSDTKAPAQTGTAQTAVTTTALQSTPRPVQTTETTD